MPRSGLFRLLQQLGPVAIGLVVLGLGSFVYLSIAGRALGPVDFAPVATLWVLFNAAGLALYQPIEQELSRETARRAALGTGSRPLLLRCIGAGSAVTAVVALGLLAAHELVSEHAFNGETVLLPLLLLGMVGLFAEHVLRGLFSGNERFARYGWQLAVDGVLRVALPAAVVLLATGTTTTLAAALVVAPLAAAALTAGRLAPLAPPGPTVPWRDVLRALGALTGAAVLSQLIVNAAPVAAQLLAGADEADRAGVFIAALVMTRIPLFFFGAVQAAFLPSLSRLGAHGDRAGFVRQTRVVVLLATGVGLAFVLGLAVAGPLGLRLLYGPEFVMGRAVMVVLGLGGLAYMVAQALTQALIARRAYRASLAGWATGSALFFACLALPFGLEAKVSTALLVGGAAAAASMVLAVRRSVLGMPDPPATVSTDRPDAAGA